MPTYKTKNKIIERVDGSIINIKARKPIAHFRLICTNFYKEYERGGLNNPIVQLIIRMEPIFLGIIDAKIPLYVCANTRFCRKMIMEKIKAHSTETNRIIKEELAKELKVDVEYSLRHVKSVINKVIGKLDIKRTMRCTHLARYFDMDIYMLRINNLRVKCLRIHSHQL
jgi:hypothetical protein